jgi:uncharacterized protein YbjT (DUF2867 family)
MNARRRIAVTGATGRVGRPLVELLEDSGHEVITISRSHGVDLISREGLEEALTGVDTIIEAATGPSAEQDAATEFFLTAAHNLHEIGGRTGVRRIVLVSIIGCDRFRGGGAFGGYYVAKTAQEKALRDGPIPTRILRAAQFHEFVGQLLDWTTDGDAAHLPAMRTQLIAARSVAEALADLATSPDGTEDGATIPEIAGPRAERLIDMARLLAECRDAPSRVEETTDSEDPDRGLLAGDGLLPGPQATLAGPTFEEWLNSPAAVEAGVR